MFDSETQVAWSYADDEEGNRNHIHLTAVGDKDDLAVYQNEFEGYTEKAREYAREAFGEKELEDRGLREASWKAYENNLSGTAVVKELDHELNRVRKHELSHDKTIDRTQC